MAKTSKKQVTAKLQAERRAENLLMRLLAVPGPSGDERAVVKFISKELQKAGVPAKAISLDDAHHQSKLGGKIGNLVVKLPGTVRGPRRMLSAHMDTVPICQGARPVREGRRIDSADEHTGLGGDDRCGCGVVLSTAIEILRGDLPHPPLTFLWTVQEEVGLHGARNVKLGMLGKPKLAFNFDGSHAQRLIIGATGGYRMKIIVKGVASHAGGHPERGVSAVSIAALAISDLVSKGWHGLIEKGKNRGTSNVGVIQGGQATNVVTDHVELRAEARSHDPKFRMRIVKEIEKAFQRAARKVRNTDRETGSVMFEGQIDYEAFQLAKNEPCLLAAKAAVKAEELEADLAIANGGLDANWLSARGIPTVSLGCGQNDIHTIDEWVNLDEYALACRVALRLATTT
ncbi:M20/M25/M40 family metallo-hydrolase [Adhaeretor mobilis]|uniref:Carboxypeptidase G2 n=1 Tax=Adhaeretor mobilis TaxID=1930276 RepID=A0A517MQK6_9BACT|nr:M20/M25/M40 family metallo-hydrolase [Adhaeretor mobilis]QDS97168.1 Carboxypeptidase G2 precursor [Adhaeretor mobilis]